MTVSDTRPSTAASSSRLLSQQATVASLMRPLNKVTEANIRYAFEREHEAKRQYAEQHRVLLKTAVSSSRALLFAEKQAQGDAKRIEYQEESGKDLKAKLCAIVPASDAEVTNLAVQLNRAMCHLFPNSRSQASYFSLFRMLDKDKSGLMSFYEFIRMIREPLRLSAARMSQVKVEAMWRWVDRDASGLIAAGEFLRLMRKGWPAFLEEQDRLAKANAAGGDLLRRPNWNFAVRAYLLTYGTPLTSSRGAHAPAHTVHASSRVHALRAHCMHAILLCACIPCIHSSVHCVWYVCGTG